MTHKFSFFKQVKVEFDNLIYHVFFLSFRIAISEWQQLTTQSSTARRKMSKLSSNVTKSFISFNPWNSRIFKYLIRLLMEVLTSLCWSVIRQKGEYQN